MTILIVAAHPDDEVLGCGGSIAKWVKSGKKVHILIMAEGATSRDIRRNREARQGDLTELGKAAQKAGDILGVSSVTLLDFPDNRMDAVDRLDVVKKVEQYISMYNPQTVVTHHAGDVNIDHQIIHHAVVTACRPQPGASVKKILTFEVLSSTEWQPPHSAPPFQPNWFEDISDTLQLKLDALTAYQSEMREWPHSRSIKAVENLAHYRGASVGVDAAEALCLLRALK